MEPALRACSMRKELHEVLFRVRVRQYKLAYIPASNPFHYKFCQSPNTTLITRQCEGRNYLQWQLGGREPSQDSWPPNPPKNTETKRRHKEKRGMAEKHLRQAMLCEEHDVG